MSIWKTPEVDEASQNVFGNQAGLYVVAGIGIAMSAPVAAFYSALFSFHTYLQIRGITTYGYFIEKSTRARAKRAKQANTTPATRNQMEVA
jgi:hypothetical protein